MSRKRSPSKNKKTNPQFWVFCEGETEEEYIKFLKSRYRFPIKIISKVLSKVTKSAIKNSKKGSFTHEKDVDFLLYDIDVSGMLEKLKQIEGVKLLVSNPSIELWFLLHYKAQNSCISTKSCMEEITKRNGINYKKGTLDNKLVAKFDTNTVDAVKRAKKLENEANPSSTIYQLIEILENKKYNI